MKLKHLGLRRCGGNYAGKILASPRQLVYSRVAWLNAAQFIRRRRGHPNAPLEMS